MSEKLTGCVVITEPNAEVRESSKWVSGMDSAIGRTGLVVGYAPRTGRHLVYMPGVGTWYYPDSTLKRASKFKSRRFYKKLKKRHDERRTICKGG